MSDTPAADRPGAPAPDQAGEATPKGLPTSDRHDSETAPGSDGQDTGGAATTTGG